MCVLTPDPDEVLDFIDPDIPLVDLPQTGPGTNGIPLAAFGLGLAAIGAGALLGKKKEDAVD